MASKVIYCVYQLLYTALGWSIMCPTMKSCRLQVNVGVTINSGLSLYNYHSTSQTVNAQEINSETNQVLRTLYPSYHR